MERVYQLVSSQEKSCSNLIQCFSTTGDSAPSPGDNWHHVEAFFNCDKSRRVTNIYGTETVMLLSTLQGIGQPLTADKYPFKTSIVMSSRNPVQVQ